MILIKRVCFSTELLSSNITCLHGSVKSVSSAHEIIINICQVILGDEIHPCKSCSHVTINYSAFLNICSLPNYQSRLILFQCHCWASSLPLVILKLLCCNAPPVLKCLGLEATDLAQGILGVIRQTPFNSLACLPIACDCLHWWVSSSLLDPCPLAKANSCPMPVQRSILHLFWYTFISVWWIKRAWHVVSAFKQCVKCSMKFTRPLVFKNKTKKHTFY